MAFKTPAEIAAARREAGGSFVPSAEVQRANSLNACELADVLGVDATTPRIHDGVLVDMADLDPINAPLYQPDTRPDYEMICGPAGSGKTYMMRELATQHAGWTLAASTGIAAVNLGDAVTINSLLGYFDTASLEDAYTQGWLQARLRKLRASGLRRILLDEVSMVEARQLTVMVRAIDEVNGIDEFMRGDEADTHIRLTLIGDPLQLGPVQGDFFFESEEWGKFAPNVTKLTEIRRQGDPAFIQALRHIREGHGELALETFMPRFESVTDMQFDGPTILARNEPVDRFNRLRHDALTGTKTAFVSKRWHKAKPPAEWKNIPEVLVLKEGALVMVLANRRRDVDDSSLVYANGDLGIYRGPSGSGDCPHAFVELTRTGEVVTVIPVTRRHEKPTGAKGVRKEAYEVQGEVTYMPLRLAYASTIHKTQGLTFDRCQINIGDHFFAHPGMLYVGLSRCRSLEGLRIVGNDRLLVQRSTVHPKVGGWL